MEKRDLRTIRLAFLGFGTIGNAFTRLVAEKAPELADEFGLDFRTTTVITRRHGVFLSWDGLDPAETLRRAEAGRLLAADSRRAPDLRAALAESGAEVLFELTPTNRETGEPAITNIRTALEAGVHVVTANKGPVVHAWRELDGAARAAGRRFLFEATVMDGTPVFSLVREVLPAAKIAAFRGILNSTSNFLLTRMGQGADFEEAVAEAQRIGIAETDPFGDIEGWDAALKVTALVNVIMGVPFPLAAVAREGIGKLPPGVVRQARLSGRPYKLVCRAERTPEGVAASVRPEQVEAGDPLAAVEGTSTLLHLETDVLPSLIISGGNPSPRTTAYGLLADLLRIYQ